MSKEEFENELISLKSVLYRFALSLSRDKDDAEDLLQDTMFKTLTHREKFKMNKNFKSWVFTIMKNEFINKYRRDQKRNVLNDITKESSLIDMNTSITVLMPDEILEAKQIVSAIEDLNTNFKLPFTMYISGYHYEEISDILEVKIGTIKSRIHFARKKLKVKLKE